jgi:WD40 repeat protein
LAVQASALLNERIDLAFLLFLEASRIADTFEARSTLFSALQLVPHLKSVLRSEPYFTRPVCPPTLAISSDGSLLVILLAGAMEVSDLAISPRRSVLLSDDEAISPFLYSHDLMFGRGCMLASTSSRAGDIGTIALCDLSRAPLETQFFKVSESRINLLAFNAKEGAFIFGTEDGKVMQWEPNSSGTPLELFPAGRSELFGDRVLAVAAKEGRILALTQFNRLLRLDSLNGRQVAQDFRIHIRAYPVQTSIALSPDRKILAVIDRDNALLLIDTDSFQPLQEELTPLEGKLSDRIDHIVGFSSDGKMLVLADSTGDVILCNPATNQNRANLHWPRRFCK